MRFVLPACALCMLVFSGCSDARYARYNTRYLPTAGSLDYDGDLRELPAKPPALDGEFKGSDDPGVARPRSSLGMKTSTAVDPMPAAGESYRTFH